MNKKTFLDLCFLLIIIVIAIAIGLAIFAAVVGDWDNFERGLFGKPCKNS